jgi:Predicted periplasmic lipoprotein (DUF2279)
MRFYRFLIIVLTFFICTGSAQNLAFLHTAPTDTTINQYKTNIKNALTNTASESRANTKLKAPLHSLAYKDNYSGFNRYSLNRKTFDPVPLSDDIVIEDNRFEYINEFQMIDGTYWKEQSDVNFSRLVPLLSTMLTVNFAIYQYQRGVWDQNVTTGLHSINWWIDVHNYQRMDKIGHFTDAYFVSDLTSKLYRWAGVSGESSIWYGALTGWMWMFEIEVSDGFFADWGFSWLDLSANTLGAGFFVLQKFFPEVLGGLHPKISYMVSDAWRNKLYTKNPKSFIDDYEGMTFWMTINPYHYFPDSWKKDYPKWLAPLGIAVGYGAEGIAQRPQYGRPQWYFGFDLDIRQIDFGNESGFFKFLKSELNFIRLPLPTVRITPSGVWYGLYF